MRLASIPLLAITLLLDPAGLAHADEVGSRREYIVRGEPVGPADAYGTVALLTRSGAAESVEFEAPAMLNYFRCSGTLIAPRVVLTAAHCVDACDGMPVCESEFGEPYLCERCDTRPIDIQTAYVAAGLQTLDDTWRAEVVPVREIVIHAGYRTWPEWGFGSPGFDRNDVHDIALLLLDVPVTARNPVPIAPVDQLPDLTTGLAQGYGLRLPEDSERLLSQGGYQSLLNETETPIENVTERLIETVEGPDRSGTCFGDSGGPLYVRLGDGVLVAGVASQLMPNSIDEICGGGTLYTSAPAYADWIYDKAPEAMAYGLAGGGCSAISQPPSRFAPLLFGALLLLLSLRGRRVALFRATFALLLLTSFGCGSDAGTDASFCTVERDPSGRFCDRGLERIDLATAEAIARAEIPEDAWLWMARGGDIAALTPDGESPFWRLQYYVPDQLELPDALFSTVTVYASDSPSAVSEIHQDVYCTPAEPMLPFDSGAIVHDAIARLEGAGVPVRVGEGGKALRIVQSHRCARWRDTWSYVAYGDATVYYDDDGTYLGMDGLP